MDIRSWISGVLQETMGGLLLMVLVAAGALVMGWAKAMGWRWAAPLLYALLTGASLYILLFGFFSQRRAPLVNLVTPIPLTGLLLAVLFAHALYIHSSLWRVRKELNLLQDHMVRYVIPRSLTPEQKATIAEYLSKHKPHALIMKVISRNEEANSYGADLQQALEDGGWPIESIIYDDAVPEGFRVEMSESMQEAKPGPVDPFDRLNDRLNPKKKPTDILREAFEQAGVIVNGIGSGSGTVITTTTITIFVGNRRHDKWVIPPPPRRRGVVPPG